MSCNLKVQVVSSCTGRNPIRRRTQSNQTADAIRSDGERNPPFSPLLLYTKMETKDTKNAYVRQVAEQKYEYGFTTDVHTDIIEKGLNEDVVRLISSKKGEPDWMLEFRLQAFRHWQTMKEPKWGHLHVPEIDYQAISYYADPLAKKKQDEKKKIDPELMKTFDKLGIPLEERLALSGVAVDAIMDSVSVKTTFSQHLAEKGIIFCSIGDAIKNHPDLVREYLGSVVPYRDNFFAALNSAVFSDGSFVYIPKGVRCPMELSSYFRINARNTGQFERTLIIADDDAYVSYLEGCTAPMRDENQLHAAIVEIVVKDNAEVKYSTVQNWYPGDENGKGGVLNLVRAARRRFAGGVLLRSRHQQLPRGRHRHEDDTHGQEYQVDNHIEGHLSRTQSELVPRTGARHKQRRQRTQLLVVRLAAARFRLRSAHLPLHGHTQRHGDSGARGYDVEDFGRPALLLQPARHTHRASRGSHRQRIRQGRAQQAAYGVRRRGAEAAQRVA